MQLWRETREVLRSAIEFLVRMFFGWHILVIGALEGTIAMIERLVPSFNLSTSTWWKLLGGGLAAAVLWTFHKTRMQRDDLKLPRESREMLSNHMEILAEIKERTLKNPSELEDWKKDANRAATAAATEIQDTMGPEYATRFQITRPSFGTYSSGSVNREHGGCRMHLEMYIENLRTIFDGLGH